MNRIRIGATCGHICWVGKPRHWMQPCRNQAQKQNKIKIKSKNKNVEKKNELK